MTERGRREYAEVMRQRYHCGETLALFQDIVDRPPLKDEVSHVEMLLLLHKEITISTGRVNPPLTIGARIKAHTTSSDLAAIADRFIALLQGIPYEYDILFDIATTAEHSTEIDWSTRVWKIANGIELLPPQPRAKPNQRILRISTEGFFGEIFNVSSALARADSTLTCLLQLGQYVGLLTEHPGARARTRGVTPKGDNAIGRIFSKHSNIQLATYPLRNSLSDTLTAAILNEQALASGTFGSVAHFFAESASPENYDPIRAALEWATAAQLGDDDSVSRLCRRV